MNRKIGLVFDGKVYNVCMNEEIIYTHEKREEAYAFYEKTVDNNLQAEETTWESIRESVEKANVDGLLIHDAYQAIEYKDIKYFHQTDKVFYTGNDEMLPLIGGHRLIRFIVAVVSKGQVENSEDLVAICVQAVKNETVYRMKESVFTLASPVFNYGYVSYNFQNKEMHKGTAITSVGFDVFKDYVLGVLGDSK